MKPVEEPDHKPDALYEGGGVGLYSTLKDYLTFSQMLANVGILNGVRIIGRKTIDLMRRNHLDERQLRDFDNSYLARYGYGLGVRTMMDPAAGHSNGSVGEFGWTEGLVHGPQSIQARAYPSYTCISCRLIWKNIIICGCARLLTVVCNQFAPEYSLTGKRRATSSS
ncbi:MAG: hypothetical protein WDZ91_03470, partial [Paenibacillaceae bacterium]